MNAEDSDLLAKCRDAWYQMLVRAAGMGRGRGRVVCSEWRLSFETFLEAVGPPPSRQHVLCLSDPEQGFVPGNVFWGTRRQRQQYVSHARVLTFGGRSLSLAGWSRELGLLPQTIRERLERGDSVESALSPTRWGNRYAPRRKVLSGASSRFVGVSYRVQDAAWEARVRVRRHLYYLGVYHSEVAAARAVADGRALIAAFLDLGASVEEIAVAIRREILAKPRVKKPERRSRTVHRANDGAPSLRVSQN